MRVILLRTLSLALFLLVTYKGFGQNCIPTGNNGKIINLPCGVNCTPLKVQVPHLKSTGDYTLVSIPYTPYAYTSPTGTEINSLYSDDIYSAAINLPFPVCFYDSTYNKVVIGSNGLMTFDISNASCDNAYTITPGIPSAGTAQQCDRTGPYYPRAAIMGAYSDLDPRTIAEGTSASPSDRKIEWRIEGTAPCRKFIVSYNRVGVYGSNACGLNTPNTFQMVIYEETSLIDFYFQQKACYSSTGSGRAIMGIQNWYYNKAVSGPGKNATQWSETNTAYRFIPSAGVTRFVKAELLDINGNILHTTTAADTATTTAGLLDLNFNNICPTAASTQYIVKSYFTSCAGSTQVYSNDTITVNKTTSLNATASSTASACGPNGSITVTIPGGVGTLPYTLVHNGGTPVVVNAQIHTFTGLVSGAHNINISTADGCSQTMTVNVASSGVLTVNHTSNPTSCTGVANGSITINPQNGVGPFQYNINNGAFGSNNTFSNLPAGIYTIGVKDASGCVLNNYQVTVMQGPPLAATMAAIPTACAGASNGSLTVTPTSGTGPYLYNINGGAFQTSNVFTNLPAGTYFIAIRDAIGCQANNLVVAVGTGAGLTATATANSTSCAGANNGSINITPANGAAPYQYSLNGGAYQAGTTVSNLAPGNYTVILKDAAGCVSGSLAVTVTQGNALLATAVSSATSCPGLNNGTVTVTPTSGSGPYSFALNGGTPQSSNVFTGIAPGNHTVVVTDGAGCTSAPVAVNIAVGAILTATASSVSTSCNGASDGSVTITAANGSGPYQYAIDNGPFVNTATFTGLSSGNHTVIVKNAAGCSSAPLTIVVPAGQVLPGSAVSTATSCSGATNGTIIIMASGGTAPYTYSLDNGPYVSTSVFTGVAEGAHTYTIKDASGCVSALLHIAVVTGPAITASATPIPTSCNGAANGSITVAATNGAAPYQYSINNGPFVSNAVFNGLAAGNYTIVIKDAAGCLSAPVTAIVTNGGSLNGTATAAATSCNGATNGSFTVVPSNGNMPYTYSLNGGTPQASNVFTGLPAGTYAVVITDGAGCVSAPIPVTVAAGAALTASLVSTPTSCSGATNGSITVTPANGNGPYTYSLNNGVFQASNTFLNLASGNYSIVARDGAGCMTSSLNAIVSPGQALSATVAVANLNCNGSNSGIATITVTGGGIATYTYSMDGNNYQLSNVFAGLAAGNYTAYIRDNNNCSGTQTFTVTQPAALTLVATPQAVRCNGQSNGTISVTGSGGTAPYQYSIGGASYQASGIFNVAAGSYTVYIKDNNNCIRQQAVDVTQPQVLSATSVTANASCDGGNDGRITVTAAGGTGAYQYSVNGTTFQSSNIFNVAPGTYTVTTRDANNCITIGSVTVGMTNNLYVTPAADETICEGRNVQLQAITNATQFAWSQASSLTGATTGTPIASPVVTTQYQVTATLGRCVAYDTVLVYVNPAPVADAGADNEICYGQGYQLRGSGGASYQWSTGSSQGFDVSSSPYVTPSQTTTYFLHVTDANNCQSLQPATITVKVTPPIVINLTRDTVVALGDQFQLHASSVATDYLWTPAIGLNDPTDPDPMVTVSNDITYTVIASTPAGCKGEGTVVLKVYKGPELYVPTAFTPNNDGKNDKFFPFPVGVTKLNYFRVFNRWGQLVFATSTMNHGWDGNFAGKELTTGTYVWVAEGVTKDNKVITKKGIVTLIR
jgi:gliding motility-associated-like protein